MNAQPPLHPAPKVLGILSTIFGGVTILMSLVGFTVSSMATGEEIPGMTAAMNTYLSAIEPGATLLLTSMIVMSLALIVIGVGQLQYRQWARSAATIWGIAGIVIVAAMTAHHYLQAAPAMERFYDAISDGQTAELLKGSTAASGIFSLVLYLPFPIVQLVLMRKPRVIAAMQR